MLNKTIQMGRLTRDPELRRTGSGIAVASFSIAVEEDYASKDNGEKETDFFDCSAWRKTGEFIAKYFKKGDMIVVSGRLKQRRWNDKDGNNRSSVEIRVEDVYFGGSKHADNNGQQTGGYAAPAGNAYAGNAGGYAAPAYPNAAPAYAEPASGYGNATAPYTVPNVPQYGSPNPNQNYAPPAQQPGYGYQPVAPGAGYVEENMDNVQLPF